MKQGSCGLNAKTGDFKKLYGVHCWNLHLLSLFIKEIMVA